MLLKLQIPLQIHSFDYLKADIYRNKISRKKIGHNTGFFSVQHLNQL